LHSAPLTKTRKAHCLWYSSDMTNNLGVWSRHLMVHYSTRNGGMHYGSDSTRERPHDRGSPSSDTT
jgi:hypothetical protein